MRGTVLQAACMQHHLMVPARFSCSQRNVDLQVPDVGYCDQHLALIMLLLTLQRRCWLRQNAAWR